MELIKRIGYGSNFNNLYIINDKIKKESKNDYGYNKIIKEINFYKNISTFLKVPHIFEYGNNYYIMEYLNNHEPLYKVFNTFNNIKKHQILEIIYNQLEYLHSNSYKSITKEIYIKCIYIETYEKLYNRFKEIETIVQKYSFITHVNKVKIISFNDAVNKIQENINNYIYTLNAYNMCITHGDCQFNNILIDKEHNEIVFIDPRGYFGNQDLYGIAEYDYAKVRFALSGYDIFDNMNINILNINDNNIDLENIFQIEEEYIFKKDIIDTFIVSIWLGNAHSFKSNEYKAIYSYFYALYLATLYL